MSDYFRRVTHLDKPLSSRLEHLDIELTERCNNNCIHCCINVPENDRRVAAREMSTAHARNVLTEAAALGCLRVRFTGGEPLLRPDFEELYLCARQLGMKVIIFTNARLITEHLADVLVRIPPLAPLEVSVYGMHASSYEAITRVPGSHAQSCQGIDLLLARNIPFIVKGAFLPPNKHEIDEFETWTRQLPGMAKPAHYTLFFDLRTRRDDEKKNKLIQSIRLTPEEGLAILTRDAERYRREMREFATKFMRPSGPMLFDCGAGRGLCIDAYGWAQPCMGVRTPELTVKIARPNTIDASEDRSKGLSLAGALDAFTHLRNVHATNQDYLQRCAVCFLKGLCEQCPAKAWTEHGCLDKPVEYLCEIAHAKARWLHWLNNDEQAWKVKNGRDRILDGA